MTSLRDEDSIAATGEYALGLMSPDEALLFEARLAREPELANELASWQRHLVEIDEAAPILVPQPALWTLISNSVALQDAQATKPRLPAPEPSGIVNLWNNLPLWRWGGMTALAATLMLGIGLNNARNQIAEKPAMVAVLLTADGETAAVVNVAANGKAQLVSLKGIPVPEGKAIEIWTLWDRSVGPRSVGLISKAGSLSLNLNNLPRPQPGQLFEMTLEPATGSPTGRPTGPVLNKGTASTAL
jgi:anti-sigma-K factor RskA